MRLRNIIFVLCFVTLHQETVYSQSTSYPHIPANHSDNTSVCWGYATARAFGRNSHAVCSATSVYRLSVPDQYFDSLAWDINSVKAKDIIDFQKTGAEFPPNGMQHVAYVRSKLSSTTTGIKLDMIEYEGGPLKTDRTLKDVIEGNGVIERGQPTRIWRLKPTFSMVLENKLGDGTDGGKIGFDGQEPNSPYPADELYWEDEYDLDAVMDGATHEGYIQRFDKWVNGQEEVSSDKVWDSFFVNWNGGTPTFVAEFNNEYNITARNSFTGISGYPGTIKVDGNTENSPHTEQVTDGSSIEIQALSHTINHIIYNFDEWNDSNTSATRTISPTDHDTLTAVFIGKPKQMNNYNLYVSSTPGQYIQFSWNQHGNSNVQYRVYRRVKPAGGSLGPEVLKATLSHSTTSWTDYDYLMTSSYTEDLLQYDARAYYTT